MTVICVKTSDVEQLRAVLKQKVGDLHAANHHVRQVHRTLDVNAADPRVRGMGERLANVAQRVEQVAREVDGQANSVGSFLTQLRALDGESARNRLSILGIAARLKTFASLARSPAAVIQGVLALGRGLRTVLPILKRGVGKVSKLIRGTTRLVIGFGKRAVQNVRRHVSDAFDRHVKHRIERLFSGVRSWWRRISEAFQRFWARAWATFSELTRKLREVTRAVLTTSARVGRALVSGALKAGRWIQTAARFVGDIITSVLRTQFKTPDRDPNAELVESETLSGTVEVSLPTEVVGLDLTLAFTANVTFDRFSDGTVDVTIGEEFAASVIAGLDLKLSEAAKVRLAEQLQAAIGRDATFRISGGRIGQQAAEMVFVQQYALRIALQALSRAGHPAQRLVARALLKKLPPQPSPVRSSAYMRITDTSQIGVTVGNSGVSTSVSRGVEARISQDHETGTRSYQLTGTVSGSAANQLFGAGISADRSLSITFGLELDADGNPSQVAVTGKALVSAGLGASAAGIISHDESVQTSSTLRAVVPLTGADRAVIGALARDLASGDMNAGAEMVRELERIASGARYEASVEAERVSTTGVSLSSPVGGVSGRRIVSRPIASIETSNAAAAGE